MTDDQFLALLRLAIGHNPEKGIGKNRKWYKFLTPIEVPKEVDRYVIQSLVQEFSR